MISMTKEDLYAHAKAWTHTKAMQHMIDALDRFFSQNVCIPKGENRHPSSDVLHQAIEGIKIQGWNHTRDEWEDDTSWFIDKDDLDYPTKYRIKPSEPVYEWQWVRLVKRSQDPKSMDYYNGASQTATEVTDYRTEDEINASGNNGKEHYLYIKIEETKRVRQ